MNIVYRRLLPSRLRSWMHSLMVECGAKGCRGFHLSHSWLPRLPGIFLDQTWYCSPTCLREALKERVEAQLGAAVTDLRHPPRMPFRLILLAAGNVSEEQLAHARSVHASDSASDVGDALVSLGYASEDEVSAARASESGCLFFNGAAQPILPAYALPRSLMRQHHAAPVHFSPVTGRLLIGFVYRIDSPLLQAIEQVTGCRVEACIITPSAWRHQMDGLPSSTYVEVNKSAYSQGRIVGMIVEHAVSSGADRVRIGLSSTALWARLAQGAEARDLVIELASDALQQAEEVELALVKEAGAVAAGARDDLPAQPSVSFPVFKRRRATL